MSLKIWKIISAFLVFLTSSLLHFIYVWFPNTFTSLLFPVNESIWEHNKIIIGSFLIWAIIEKIFFKEKKNSLWAGFVSGIFCALLVMLVFTPVYFLILKTQDNIIVTFIIFFIAIAISEILNYKILQKEYKPKLEKLALIGFGLVIVLNALLTYYPIKIGIFYDYNKLTYGIKH